MAKMVLLVENHEDTRELLSAVLEHAGYDLLCARNGRQALAYLEEILPSAVILDFMIGDMTGVDVAAAMRADQKLRAIPAAILTAAPTEAVASQLRAAHLDLPVIQKPIDPDRLLLAVARLCDRAPAPV